MPRAAWLTLADRVQRSVQRAFGGLVSYQPLVSSPGLPAFDLSGVWRGPGLAEDVETGAMVSTVAPTLGIRLADLPAGVDPAQGDRLVFADAAWAILREQGTVWEVFDLHPDGQSGLLLDLRRITGA